jgi:hypothetical protein
MRFFVLESNVSEKKMASDDDSELHRVSPKRLGRMRGWGRFALATISAKAIATSVAGKLVKESSNSGWRD